MFARMRAWHVPLILGPLAIEWANWHEPVRTVMLLAILGLAPAAEVAIVYCALGHRRAGPWASRILAVLGLVAFMVGLNLTLQQHAVPVGWPVFAPLGVCALLYGVLVALAVRGKRALLRLPHPYFAVG